MTIKYADGTARNTGDSRDDIIKCLDVDLPKGYVIYSGLVWKSEEDSADDDGARAVAEILNENGQREVDFE